MKLFNAGYNGLVRNTLYVTENQMFNFLCVLTWSENEGGQHTHVLTPLENRRGQYRA